MDASVGTRGSWFGLGAGAVLAPLAALGSQLRHARLFHPNGVLLHGVARIAPDAAHEQRAVGARLAGPVLARFSGAWWKTRQWPDVLGCALRFGPHAGQELAPGNDSQDLLLATIRNPLTTLLAPLTTHVSDYLANDYFGVSPFRAEPLGQVKLRLRPRLQAPNAGPTRAQRLAGALELGPITLRLEARSDRLGARYQPVAQLELYALDTRDPSTLRFDPFANARGLVPVGLVHALRVRTYAASRRARHADGHAAPLDGPPRA